MAWQSGLVYMTWSPKPLQLAHFWQVDEESAVKEVEVRSQDLHQVTLWCTLDLTRMMLNL